MKTTQIHKIIQDIVEKLYYGNFETVIKNGFKKRVKEEWIINEIKDYPGKMTLPPQTAYEDVEIYDLKEDNQKMANFCLWFDGEKSDLTISVLFLEENMTLKYTFWDILVP